MMKYGMKWSNALTRDPWTSIRSFPWKRSRPRTRSMDPWYWFKGKGSSWFKGKGSRTRFMDCVAWIKRLPSFETQIDFQIDGHEITLLSYKKRFRKKSEFGWWETENQKFENLIQSLQKFHSRFMWFIRGKMKSALTLKFLNQKRT